MGDLAATPQLPLPHLGAIVLAGGLGRRMGYRQKGLLSLNAKPLISYAIELLERYSQEIVISANEQISDYAAFDYPVVSDLTDYHQRGPLAGIYSAATKLSDTVEFIQVLPCDTPFLARDIVQRMYDFLIQHPEFDLVVARCRDKIHPVIMQCRRPVLSSLKAYLDDPRELNRVMQFIQSCRYGILDFEDEQQFLNINTSDLLAQQE